MPPTRITTTTRGLAAAALAAAFAGSAAALVSGATLLETALPGGMPAGNLIAALALVSLAAIAFVCSRPESAFHTVTRGLLIAAMAWLPASVALAGDLALNFSGWRGTAWLWMTATLVVAILAALVWSLALGAIVLLRRATRA